MNAAASIVPLHDDGECFLDLEHRPVNLLLTDDEGCELPRAEWGPLYALQENGWLGFDGDGAVTRISPPITWRLLRNVCVRCVPRKQKVTARHSSQIERACIAASP